MEAVGVDMQHVANDRDRRLELALGALGAVFIDDRNFEIGDQRRRVDAPQALGVVDWDAGFVHALEWLSVRRKVWCTHVEDQFGVAVVPCRFTSPRVISGDHRETECRTGGWEAWIVGIPQLEEPHLLEEVSLVGGPQ